MTVSAVVRLLVPVVIPAVAQFVIQFRFQTIFHKLGYGVLKQILYVLHAAHICQLQQFSYLGSPVGFLGTAFFFLPFVKPPS